MSAAVLSLGGLRRARVAEAVTAYGAGYARRSYLLRKLSDHEWGLCWSAWALMRMAGPEQRLTLYLTAQLHRRDAKRYRLLAAGHDTEG